MSEVQTDSRGIPEHGLARKRDVADSAYAGLKSEPVAADFAKVPSDRATRLKHSDAVS